MLDGALGEGNFGNFAYSVKESVAAALVIVWGALVPESSQGRRIVDALQVTMVILLQEGTT